MSESRDVDKNKSEITQQKSECSKDHCDLDLQQITSYQRSARNGLVLQFLSLLLFSFSFGLLVIQINILWQSRESLVMDLVAQDRRLLSYPKFYQVPHNEETWCWDPASLLLKVNTSIFVR